MRKYIFILSIALALGCKMQPNSNATKSIYIHFVDDFKGNLVSLNLNGQNILEKKLFRKGSVTQLRQMHPYYLRVDQNSIQEFSEGQKIGEQKAELKTLLINSNLILVVDTLAITKPLSFDNGKYLLISYNEGDIKIQQSELIQ